MPNTPRIVWKSPHILLVEDHLSLLENTQEILEIGGYHVHPATNTLQAIAWLERHTPSLILCDVRMPGGAGDLVLEYVRQHPECGRIPFVYISSTSEEKEVKQALHSGADAFLVKPFSLEKLLETVREVLAKQPVVYRGSMHYDGRRLKQETR